MSPRRSSATVRSLAPTLEENLPALVEGLTRRLRREIPHYADLPRPELRDQVEEQCVAVLREMTGERLADATGPAAYGRMRAEQGVPLEVVLHAYRVAWAELWSGLLDAAQQAGGPGPADLLAASSEFFWMADDYAGRMLAAYRQHATQLLLRREQERSATLEGVFSGYLNGAEKLWEAAAMLDLPYEGLFIVAAAEPTAPGREALPGVKEALLAAGIGSAWHLGPDIEAGIISLRTPDSLPVLIEELSRGARVSVGLSSRFRSLAEAPHALHLSRLTLAALPPAAPTVGQFDESPLAALLAASPRTAQELARSVLGNILELPVDDQETILSTLTAWFDAGGSTAVAAERLFCHPNTVRYRIHRAEKYTGRSLEDPRQSAEILAALVALRVIPFERAESNTD